MNYIEIQAEHPYSPDSMSKEDYDDLSQLLETSGLKPIIHGSYHDVNLSSLKPVVRETSVEIISSCIDFSTRLGSDSVVIHAGSCPANQAHNIERGRSSFYESLRQLSKYANDRNIILGLENKQNGQDIEIILNSEEHVRYISEFYDLGVRAVFDMGHALTTGVNLKDYVRALGKNLVEVHLHDNDGIKDLHWPLGKGNADVAGVFSALESSNFDGPVILELDSREDLEESLECIKHILE